MHYKKYLDTTFMHLRNKSFLIYFKFISSTTLLRHTLHVVVHSSLSHSVQVYILSKKIIAFTVAATANAAHAQ